MAVTDTSFIYRRSGSGDEERTLRVDAGEQDVEVAALLRELRAGALYELRVRVFTRLGASPLGHAVTARAPLPDTLAGVNHEEFKERD